MSTLSGANHSGDSTPLKAALKYARLGYRVFPLVPKTKKPHIWGWPTEATTDTDELVQWWDKHPCDFVAMVPAEDECVIDVEGPDGDHAVNGLPTYADLVEKLGPLDEFPVATTPSGGMHIWGSHDLSPAEVAAHPGAGIDVKTSRGFVVAPPASGRHWQRRPTGKPPKLPDAWQEWIRKARPKPIAHKSSSLQGGDSDAYINAAIRGELEELANTPKSGGRHGGRDTALFAKAARLDELGVQRDWARERLVDACRQNGFLAEEAKTTATQRSIGDSRKRMVTARTYRICPTRTSGSRCSQPT